MFKLEDLASKSVTTLELLHPVTKELTGVKITGFTPDSKEWRDADKKLSKPNQKQYITVQKKETKIELDSDSGEKQRELVKSIVTDIQGIDKWEYTKEKGISLLGNPIYSWILDDWIEHLDDRANFFTK